jgi:hypothetical protein
MENEFPIKNHKFSGLVKAKRNNSFLHKVELNFENKPNAKNGPFLIFEKVKIEKELEPDLYS